MRPESNWRSLGWWRSGWRRWVLLLFMALVVGTFLKHVAQRLHAGSQPAGFVGGMVHGALMPCTLPTLIMGHDVPIYAEHNRGWSYKLGYASGVNVCGAVFFGFMYRRVGRLREHRRRLRNLSSETNREGQETDE